MVTFWTYAGESGTTLNKKSADDKNVQKLPRMQKCIVGRCYDNVITFMLKWLCIHRHSWIIMLLLQSADFFSK